MKVETHLKLSIHDFPDGKFKKREIAAAKSDFSCIEKTPGSLLIVSEPAVLEAVITLSSMVKMPMKYHKIPWCTIHHYPIYANVRSENAFVSDCCHWDLPTRAVQPGWRGWRNLSSTRWGRRGLSCEPWSRSELHRKSIGKTCYNWLVVWNMNFMTFHILGIVTPTDELIFFRGVETTNQIICWNHRSIICK